MSKQGSETLYDAITNISDELIEEAQTVKPKRKASPLKRWSAAAACLCIVAAGGLYAAGQLHLLGGSSSSGGNGTDPGGSYMSYAGPVFPLTVTENAADLTAQRSVRFDFSPYAPGFDGFHGLGCFVTDGYVLTNPTDRDVTCTAIYPFAAGLNDDGAVLPAVTADGAAVETALHIGPYSGGFAGAIGSEEEGSLNLAELSGWEAYKVLIENGYMERAFDDWPALDQPVAVYELRDRYAEAADHEKYAPSLNMEFTIDYDRTTILSYGFNGGKQDARTGYCARSTHIPQDFNPDYGESAYLIVLGDDIGDYTLQGYRDGGCDRGEELSTVTADVVRYETTLGAVFEQAADAFLAHQNAFVSLYDQTIMDRISREVFLGAAAELLYDYGLLSEDAVQRYDFGMLEDIFSETLAMQRLMYLTFDVTVSAGGSVNVTAAMVKKSSHDFAGAGKNRDGYDMVTRLGSTLTFTSQTASISSTDAIEIVSQNFGFDPANGVTEVALDEAREHYYLEVRKSVPQT